MNLETNSEPDLEKKVETDQSSIWKKLKVFGSRSWSISELETEFLNLKTNSELDLKTKK